MRSVRIWDWPTRAFHWLLAASFIGLIITGNAGGLWMDWHLPLGYFVLSLIIFRLLWGIYGGYWSRFSSFIYSPVSLYRYLRGQSPLLHRAGHSPLAALSVFALLLALSVQVISGLMTDDAVFYAGPWVAWASPEWIMAASRYHDELGKFLVVGLVVLHLGAIAYHKWVKREALVSAMLRGDKQLEEAEDLPTSRDAAPQWLLAAATYLLSAGITYWLLYSFRL